MATLERTLSEIGRIEMTAEQLQADKPDAVTILRAQLDATNRTIAERDMKIESLNRGLLQLTHDKLDRGALLAAKSAECERLRAALNKSGKTQIYCDGFDAAIEVVKSIRTSAPISDFEGGKATILSILARTHATIQKGVSDIRALSPKAEGE